MYDDVRTSLEYGVPAHILTFVFIFEVKRTAMNSRLPIAVFDLFVELGEGHVGYGGGAQWRSCGGGGSALGLKRPPCLSFPFLRS